MTLLETPLCKEGLLKVHLHLQDGRIVDVNPEVRLPRNFDRFVGLMEQLLINGRVPPDGVKLMSITERTLPQLVASLSAESVKSRTWLTSESGRPSSPSSILSAIPDDASMDLIIGIGAFPHGSFSKVVEEVFTDRVRLDRDVMMAWHVCAEIVWLYSSKLGVLQQRLTPD
jgi:rRNA small subunit pseudouridine methyltransferase Nep1